MTCRAVKDRMKAMRYGRNLHVAWGGKGGLVFTVGRLRLVSSRRLREDVFESLSIRPVRTWHRLFWRFYWRHDIWMDHLPEANLDIPMPRVRREAMSNYQGYTMKGNPGEENCTLVIDDKEFKGLPEQVLGLLLLTSRERDHYRDMVKGLEDSTFMA